MSHPSFAMTPPNQSLPVKFDLPDHPFWNSQKTTIINYSLPTTLNDRLYAVSSAPRKLSRKLPPILTESLENVTTTRQSIDSADSPLNVSLALPVVTLPPKEFVLQVAKPSSEFGALPQSASTLVRKSISVGSISNPSDFRKLSTMSRPDSFTDSDSPACSSTSGSSGSASTCGTWSVLDELEFQEQLDRRRVPKESRRDKKIRRRHEAETFDEFSAPSTKQLFDASLMDVIDEKGQRVRFGDLIRHRKTVVIFIRHWFCPLCAQYINSILNEVKLETLEQADVDLIIIGNGSDKMIDGYRNKHFKCPFKMYTDPKLRLYRALGLTRQTGDAGADEDAGEYLVQSGMEATLQTLKRATQMPLRKPGHFLQIGGEFVFDGPMNCIYTHRMTTTRNHAPIRDVVSKAGVKLEFIHYEPGPPPPPVHLDDDDLDLDRWQHHRQAQLDRITALKESRRSGKTSLSSKNSRVRIVSSDDDLVDEFGAVHL